MTQNRWAEVVAAVNDTCGTNYRLGRPLAGGLQGGAWTVTDGCREPRVLTWTQNPGLVGRRRQTAELIEVLCRRGYPTPRWRHWGVLPAVGARQPATAFAITDLAAGTTATWSSLPLDLLLDAVELQAGAAQEMFAADTGGAPGSWSSYLRWALAAPEGPRRDLAGVGASAEELLRAADRAADIASTLDLPTGDAVHGDLCAGNLLLDDSGGRGPRLAIIDADALGPGTRVIDHAWLFRDAATHGATEHAQALRRAGIAVAGPEVWSCAVALACLELAAFVARNGEPSNALREVELMTRVLAS